MVWTLGISGLPRPGRDASLRAPRDRDPDPPRPPNTRTLSPFQSPCPPVPRFGREEQSLLFTRGMTAPQFGSERAGDFRQPTHGRRSPFLVLALPTHGAYSITETISRNEFAAIIVCAVLRGFSGWSSSEPMRAPSARHTRRSRPAQERGRPVPGVRSLPRGCRRLGRLALAPPRLVAANGPGPQSRVTKLIHALWIRLTVQPAAW
jgi:hypothetical protein